MSHHGTLAGPVDPPPITGGSADPLVAIAGSPNSGKTTLFNRLAGERQMVGNWPGHTVERHEGSYEVDRVAFRVVDLPGTYGLVAVSADEEIAVGFLLEQRPDVVITVVDASNLDGSLHLAAQVAEAGLRQVIALNMADVAARREIPIDVGVLGDAFRAPVVPTVARRGEGVDALRRAVAIADPAPRSVLVVDYGPLLEPHIAGLVEILLERPGLADLGSPRWIVVQLLAGDTALSRRIAGLPGAGRLMDAITEARRSIAAATGGDAAVAVAEQRFAWLRRTVNRASGVVDHGTTWSDRLDRVLTHRFAGVAVFLAVMWVVLRFTTDVTAPLVDWIDATVQGPVSRWMVALLGSVGLGGGWVERLMVDGILAGVGGVLVFVPVLGGLYLMLGILEDSGYLARAAAVMDRMMRSVGLPGKAFVPMVIGFGCTVPAIYATRTLDTRRDRLLTGMIVPFMSCGARLPVYVLLAGVFFAGSQSAVVFAMYLLGILVAVLVALLIGRTALREDGEAPFLMVLPEFRLPSARVVWASTRQRTWAFVSRAGTIILAASVIVWILLAIPIGGTGRFADTDVSTSAFGSVSRMVAPAMEPLGLGEWEQSGALLSGLIAKEVVVATMSQMYSTANEGADPVSSGVDDELGDIGLGFLRTATATVRAVPGAFGVGFPAFADDAPGGLDTAIRGSFERGSGGHGALAAMAFMVFVLLYTPCMAATSALRHEFGVKWMWVSVTGQLVIAWIGAFAVYQGGRLVGLG
ncbi:MAG: ferrous iron transport protein B [Actinomycetota bacterium]